MVIENTNPISASSEAAVTVSTPNLQSGDRLNRIEFERRFNAMRDVNHAELVEGVVYMPSPVSAKNHGEPHFDLNGFLFVYRAHTPGVRGGDNSSLRLDRLNMPQPDSYLRIEHECGGRSRLVDGLIDGPPELVVEVAASSVSHDLHDKLQAYQRNLVQEYLVWRVVDRKIDWFELNDGKYRLMELSSGIYRSRVFPGLWLDTHAALADDANSVLQTLQQGLDSESHGEFVSKLAASGNRQAVDEP